MASNQSFSQFGMEAMNSYFMATTNTMISTADANMPPDHHGGSFSFAGDHPAGGASTTEDIGAHFTANNTMLASFASQLYGPAPHDIGARMPPVDKMSDGFGASETYYLAGLAEAGYFAFPPPAASELSLSLCSSLTHANRVDIELAQVHPHFSGEVLSRSRYAQAAQQVLSEVVSRVLDVVGVADAADSVASGIDSDARPSLASSCSTAAPSAVSSNQLMASPEEHSHGGGGGGDDGARSGEAHESLRSELMKMLQLMDQRYNQCLDEIQNTTAKFNSLIQSGNGGGVCAPFAHCAVSVMYRGLRRRITSEIMVVSRPRQRRHGRGGQESPSTVGERERSWEATFIQKHWALQQLRRGEAQQCWRPQRGLPEKSVAVLKAWMFENFLRPYPKDNEKDMLAARSGLSRSQVSNWFINARVRLWKPMIEEMYEELNKTSSGIGAENSAMEHFSNQDLVS